MITELKKEEFQRIAPLLTGEYINLEIESVAEGFIFLVTRRILHSRST